MQAEKAAATWRVSTQQTVGPISRPTHLVGELADAGAQDGVDAEGCHLARVLGDEVAQLQPQLVLALALQAAEGVVVDNLCHLARCLLPQPLHAQQAAAQPMGHSRPMQQISPFTSSNGTPSRRPFHVRPLTAMCVGPQSEARALDFR